MAGDTFEIETTESHIFWAERRDSVIAIHRTERSDQGADEVLLEWDIAVLLNLFLWADQEERVTSSITGVLSHQVRQHAKELGLTPEMFVWHAVKVFIEVGSDQQ